MQEVVGSYLIQRMPPNLSDCYELLLGCRAIYCISMSEVVQTAGGFLVFEGSRLSFQTCCRCFIPFQNMLPVKSAMTMLVIFVAILMAGPKVTLADPTSGTNLLNLFFTLLPSNHGLTLSCHPQPHQHPLPAAHFLRNLHRVKVACQLIA